MTTKRWIAVISLVGLLVAVPACSAQDNSSRSAGTLVTATTPNASSVHEPALPKPAAAVPASPLNPARPAGAPRMRDSAQGAEKLVRAYITALNNITVHEDVALVRKLSDYTLDGCTGCDSFQSMGYYNIATARRVSGQIEGNQLTITALDASVDPAFPATATADLGCSASEYRLLDAHGKLVSVEAASTVRLLLSLEYLDGAWHIATLELAG